MNRRESIRTPIINFGYSELFKMNTTNGLTNQNKEIICSRSEIWIGMFDHVERDYHTLKYT